MKNIADKIGKILIAFGLFFLAREFSNIAILLYSGALVAYVIFMDHSRREKIVLPLIIIAFGGMLFFGVENLPISPSYGIFQSVYFFLRDTPGHLIIITGLILVSIRRIKSLFRKLID